MKNGLLTDDPDAKRYTPPSKTIDAGGKMTPPGNAARAKSPARTTSFSSDRPSAPFLLDGTELGRFLPYSVTADSFKSLSTGG